MPPSRVTYIPTGPSAAQRAQSILGPQLAQNAAYGAHQNAVIQSFARSLLGQLKPVAGQVGADYNQAIQQIGSLSDQASKYLSGQNPSPLQQALGASVGAPPEQQAQSAQALSNVFQGGAGVLGFTGGTIPGAELAGNKAAAMASARQLPGIAALKGQQDLASGLWQQSQDRMKLEATRPQLVQDAQSNIDTANYRAATLGQSQQKLAESTRQFDVSRADKAAATKAANAYKYTALATTTDYKNRALAVTTDYKNRALAATNAYKQGQLSLGYTKVAQTAKDKAADRAATKTYHDSYLAHLTAGDSERVAHDKASEAAATTRNAISATNAQTSRINARTSRIRASNAAIAANNANAPKYSSANSRSLGYRADQYGNPMGGKYTALPGFKATKTPGIYAKAGSSTKKKGISATSYACNLKQAGQAMETYYWGDAKKGITALPYPQAVKRAMDRFSITRADAIALANDYFAPDEAGRPPSKKQIMNPSSAKSGLLTGTSGSGTGVGAPNP